MPSPMPPPRPTPLLPDPTIKEPGQHLKRGFASRYLWEVHGIINPRLFMALMTPLVALFIFCLVMAARAFAAGNY